MNKLLVSDIIKLNSGEYDLSTSNNKLNIEVNGNVCIYLINQVLDELSITLGDNSTLNLYKMNIKKENNLVVNIYEVNNTVLNYNESIINDKDNSLIINNYLNGNNNKSNINIRNISNLNNSKVIINAYIKDDTHDNIALEDLKGINNGGFIHIEPNIIVDSNEVEANHLTTIGNIDKESLNYLMSKGINEKNSKKIILKGFIYSNMDEYIKAEVKIDE